MSEEQRGKKKVTRTTTPVAFTLDEERIAWLDKEAEKRKLNRSEFLRRIIDDLRDKQAEKPS